MTNPIALPQWSALAAHKESIASQHMRDWFATDKDRFPRYSVTSGGILLDYSRNRIQDDTLNLLCDLAKNCQLSEKIAALFSGQPINTTEKRSVLHTALRDLSEQPLYVKGENIVPAIVAMRNKMRSMVEKIHNKSWLGITGKPITDIVTIGIGGSYLGPKMCVEALKDFAVSDLKFHFVSSVDEDGLTDVLAQINPETTLFLISSKTFSTIETLTNARTVVDWMKSRYGSDVMASHFVAITTASDKAIAFGIPESHILPLWDWVGGRYSVWSAIGLPLMMMIGPNQFDAFLAGAKQMDTHFSQSPFHKNMPVLLALLSIWYTNFFHTTVQAIIPYSHRLRYLVPYLQQAEMESNGKNISLNNEAISYATGPVIFGEEGCNGQHAYHQLLLQGQHLIPVDFILVGKNAALSPDNHHDILLASGLSQASALMRGRTLAEALAPLIAAGMDAKTAENLALHRSIPGNRPSNIIFLDQLNPQNLGALIALYEHKIFVEGVIWNINSFDQWGVELGKELLPAILQQVQSKHNAAKSLDAATSRFIDYVRIRG